MKSIEISIYTTSIYLNLIYTYQLIEET